MLKTILGSMIGSGGALAALWWMVNRSFQINGMGWLERQPFPLNNVWVFAAVGAVIGAILGFIRYRRQVVLKEELAEVSAVGEVELEPEPDAGEFNLPPMPLFANVHSVENRIGRTQDGIRVQVFDLTTAAETSEGHSYTKKTIVLLPAEGLAHFKLHAKTVGFRFLAWIGAQGVTFDTAAGNNPEDREAIESFERLYQLSSHDTTDLAAGTPEVFAEEDDAARQAFSLNVLKWLAKRSGWSAESHGGYLALWRGSETPGARRRLGMIDDALRIRDVLLQPGTVVPPRPGTDRSRQSARFQGALLGGVLGLFGSFFVGGIATMAVFFRRKPGVNNDMPFELFLFPAFLAIGTLLGIFIGSRLPIKKPLLQKPKDPKLEKRVGCAILFGLFGGFFLGGVIGGALAIGLDLPMDDHTTRVVLFFGTIGIGTIAGPIVCGVLAKKILTRFQREKT